jgi:hypothetical protein
LYFCPLGFISGSITEREERLTVSKEELDEKQAEYEREKKCGRGSYNLILQRRS